MASGYFRIFARGLLDSCCTIKVDKLSHLSQHITGDLDMNNTTVSNDSPAAAPPEITLIPNNSLLTETPEEGRQLAVKMARLIIKMTQADEEKRLQLRDVYGNDAMMLIAVG
jgi:hypothetical protein